MKKKYLLYMEKKGIIYIRVLSLIIANRFKFHCSLYVTHKKYRAGAYAMKSCNPIKPDIFQSSTRIRPDPTKFNPHPTLPDKAQPAPDPTRQGSTRTRPRVGSGAGSGRVGCGFGSGRVALQYSNCHIRNHNA